MLLYLKQMDSDEGKLFLLRVRFHQQLMHLYLHNQSSQAKNHQFLELLKYSAHLQDRSGFTEKDNGELLVKVVDWLAQGKESNKYNNTS
ncbi:hypothetical protein ACFVP8_02445 [Viridibacillus arvi]|uniref:hypothetical protein n=1 Tax=Viridibacillus arvi TaxID=263475 RepID=UPI0036A4EF6C